MSGRRATLCAVAVLTVLGGDLDISRLRVQYVDSAIN